MKMIPNEIGNLKSITHLDLSDNQLYFLPENIGNLEPTIKYLNIAHNQIKIIPPEIGMLFNLQALYIENNEFIAFPCTFRNLIELKEFSLDWFKYMNPSLPQLI